MKKESRRTISRVLFRPPKATSLSFIYSMSHPMAQAFYPLPNYRAGNPNGGSLHELAAPKMHSRHVTVPLVGSYPTFSPFQSLHQSKSPKVFPNPIYSHTETVVIFFCIAQPSRTASTLGSGMPCAARTFLLPPIIWWFSDRPSDCFHIAKLTFFFFKALILLAFSPQKQKYQRLYV